MEQNITSSTVIASNLTFCDDKFSEVKQVIFM
jgi:hypothetical protein